MHKQFLLKALEQATLGRGKCSPNPSVGAIAVKDKTIIAQACHKGAGMPHAEQLLVAQFPKNTPGVTLYVTLEPCNHWGRTPPCVDFIIEHRIEKVVYAYKDPNPTVVKNGTPSLLKEHGIEVLFYEVAEINDFYKSYQLWMTTNKPWVTAKIAQTLNGKIAPLDGKKIMLSNTKCSEFTHQQRLCADVILTTATTVNCDDPLLTARVDDREISKNIAIIDAKLELNYESQALNLATICHVFYDESLEKPQNNKNCIYHGLKIFDGKFDLSEIIGHLGRLGYHDVWVEAGGKMFSALHLAGLVNTTYIYIVPSLLDDDAINAYSSTDIFTGSESISWQSMGNNMLAKIDWK